MFFICFAVGTLFYVFIVFSLISRVFLNLNGVGIEIFVLKF